MQEIGTVISSELGSSSQEFWFVVNDNKGVPVRRGQLLDEKQGEYQKSWKHLCDK